MIDDPKLVPVAAPKPAKPQAPPRIPRRAREAIKLYTEGRVKTWAEAARKIGCSREYIARCLGKPHVAVYLRDRAAHVVALSAGRAAPRLLQLLDSPSEKVSFEASKFALQTAGIGPSRDPSVNVIYIGRLLHCPSPSPRPATPAPVFPASFKTEIPQMNPGLA
jgi:hypothetical protein